MKTITVIFVIFAAVLGLVVMVACAVVLFGGLHAEPISADELQRKRDGQKEPLDPA